MALIDHSSRRIENSKADSDVNYNSPAPVISEGKNISKCPKNNSCNILTKNVAAFALHKNLPEKKNEEFGLMALAENISKKA